MFVCLIIVLLSALVGCDERLPIEGTAVIIDFDYGVYNRRVTFTAIVIGATVDSDKVVRRWSISSLQFQQLEIGDVVGRVDGIVIKLD